MQILLCVLFFFFNFKIFYWHKNENVVNKLAPNISFKCILQYWGRKNYPSLLFFPLLPTFLGVGGAR